MRTSPVLPTRGQSWERTRLIYTSRENRTRAARTKARTTDEWQLSDISDQCTALGLHGVVRDVGREVTQNLVDEGNSVVDEGGDSEYWHLLKCSRYTTRSNQMPA